MKKTVLFFVLVIFAVTALAFAAEKDKQPLRPAQKIMQDRAALLKGMNKSLAEGKFDAIAQNATTLAAESKATAGKLPSPLAKEITLALASLAKEAADAATAKDAGAVKTKIGAIKGKCDECHVKIRDKK